MGPFLRMGLKVLENLLVKKNPKQTKKPRCALSPQCLVNSRVVVSTPENCQNSLAEHPTKISLARS